MQVAQQVVESLAGNVTDVVMSPGSRNSPLAYALLARRDIRVHMRIDERSAAFTALGMARVQRRHVGVVMTSGTAVANTLPAVVEAHYSHTPLAIISADRPERLVGTGASQTIEQQGIFGVYADTTQVTGADDIAAMAQRFREDLQVHINVAFDAPLVDATLPDHTSGDGVREPAPAFVDHGEVAVDLSKNTLVIAGDEAWEVEGLQDVPTIAEPSAPGPYHPVHPAAAHIFRKAQVSANDYVVNTKVEQVIVVGHPTLHRGVLALMNDPDIELVVLSRTKDFTNQRGDEARLGTTVKVTGEPSREWMKICEGATDMAGQAVRETLEDEELGFTGLHVAAAVCDTLAVGDTLVLGSSNPVRDASFVGMPFDGVDTYAARGAAGIDGTVSQAVGVALATQQMRPDEIRAPRTLALMGDLTFIHDVNGLLIGPDEPRPGNLTIVVANDDGGGIFEGLEPGADHLRDAFERAFGTPHGTDVEKLAHAYGADYRRAETLAELGEVLLELEAQPNPITVVEAATTRATRRALAARLNR